MLPRVPSPLDGGQVVVPRYGNYEEGWDTTVRKFFNVAGQVGVDRGGVGGDYVIF